MEIERNTALAVAVITGLCCIIGGILSGISVPVYTNSHSEGSALPGIEIVFAESVSDACDSSVLKDTKGNLASPPYIDIILLNRGKGFAIIKRLDLEIINAALNVTPVLSYKFDDDYMDNIYKKISIDIINEGWGPAKQLELTCFMDLGEYSNHLKIANNQLNWIGSVKPGETLVLDFEYRPQEGIFVSFSDRQEITYENYIYEKIYDGKMDVEIAYKDVSGNITVDYLSKDIYLYKKDRPVENKWVVDANAACWSNGVHIAHILSPLEIFYIDSIDPEMDCPSAMSFNVRHYLAENEIDRIILNINSTNKSGKIEYRIKIFYNSDLPAISNIMTLEWTNTNRNYLENIRRIDILV